MCVYVFQNTYESAIHHLNFFKFLKKLTHTIILPTHWYFLGSTVCLGKLNLIMWAQLQVQPISATAPADSKNEARFKGSQIWL
jgi:hypothetical protein